MTSDQTTGKPTDGDHARHIAASDLRAFEDLCGDLDMRIAVDGTWFYRGSPIGRKPLVKLFASVLQIDGKGQYWLITPVEKGRIEVDDVPFVAVEMTVDGSGKDQTLTMRTNLDDIVTVNDEHPLRVEQDPATGEPRPYVMIRNGLEARVNRPVFYDLVELGVEREIDGVRTLGVWSASAFFVIGPMPDGETEAPSEELPA